MFSKNFLSISDFAKISGVSRQTLIYYDRIGLFSPAYIADNKYRMYSHNQVDNLGIITLLSDLGLPLKEIKKIVNNISITTITKTLNYQLSTIQEKIEKLMVLRDMTQIRLNQIEEGIHINCSTPYFCLQEITENIPICIGKTINADQKTLTDDTFIEFFNHAEHKGLPAIFSLGFVKDSRNIMKKELSTVSHMWFRLKNKNYADSFLETGTYIIGYIKGDYNTTNKIYESLIEYTKARGFILSNNIYEEYLIDELSEKNPNNFILKIYTKIK